MIQKKHFLLIGLILLISVACSITPAATPTSTPVAENNVLLQDDFSDTGSGWEVGEYETGTIGYKDGAYSVISSEETKAMWGAQEEVFANLIIKVETTQISAGSDNNNDYGIMCRTQDTGEGYLMLISGDGYYSIQKYKDGEFVPLLDWTESSKINQGNASNTLQAACIGNKLTFWINDEEVATVEDSDFTEGHIGLTATTYETTLTEIHFDNLLAWRP